MPHQDAAAFYQSRRDGNRQALLENRVNVLPVIQQYIARGTDTMIGGYSSFCFVAEQENGNEVVAQTIVVLDELLAQVGQSYRTPFQDLHFHTHVHAFPTLPEAGGTIYDEERVRRFLEISEELISATPQFVVEFRGIACTRDAILVCGYAEAPLDDLRERYYTAIERYPDAFILPEGQTINSIREKYGQGLAAVTAARLLATLVNPADYVAIAEKHAEITLGTIGVTHLTFTAQNGWIDIRNSSNDREGYWQKEIALKN